MKSASTATVDALKNDASLNIEVRCLAEWNYNRYAEIESVSSGFPDIEPELFPIASIAEPRRPQKSGVAKLWTNENEISSGFVSRVPRARTYVAAKDDPYKYWISHVPSNTIGEPDFTFAFPEQVSPSVVYKNSVLSNKIVIGLENTFVNVEKCRVEVTHDGTTWDTVSTNPSVNLDGQIILWRDVQGAWGSTPFYENPDTIRGVRLIVDAVDEPDTYVAVIEVSARLENDLSQFVSEWSYNEEVSDRSFIAPIGKASSNNGSITLSNVDGRFSNENPATIYEGIIDKNVQFSLDTIINGESVRVLTGYTESWAGQQTENVVVRITDDSEFMKAMNPPQIVLEDHTVGAIIWRLCDIMGFTNYEYVESAEDRTMRVPYFWTDGTQSMWEVISELSEATQTAVFFDAYGVMQIRSRNAAFNAAKPVDWNLDAVRNGTKLPDIVSYEETNEFEANSVDVNYMETNVSDFNNGLPRMEVMWQPEDLVLRASPLTSGITTNSTYVWIPGSQAVVWPYESLVNIDGELIRYKGKEYKYWTTSGSAVKTIYSDDEKRALDDDSDPNIKWRNAFTGGLKITERGVNGSPVAAHSITDGQNASRQVLWDGVLGPKHVQASEGTFKNSIMNVTTNHTWSWFHNFVWTIKNQSFADQYMTTYGTRIRFNSGVGPEYGGEAGIFFGANSSYSGLFVSLYTTDAIEKGLNRLHNELVVWMRDNNGNYVHANRGIQLEVLRDKWYDLDVTVTQNFDNGTVRIGVMVDGVSRWVGTLSSAWPHAGPYHGIQVGTHCGVDFEYYYAVSSEEPLPDQSSILDHVRGGFVSQVMDRWLLNSYLGSTNPYLRSAAKSVVEDFGSWVHEVREFDVKWEEPVVHSKLYFSNDTQAVCPYYESTPFGAKFAIANAYRWNAILVGEDSQTFSAENAVDQKTFIYGRKIEQAEPLVVNARDNLAIRRRGEVKTEFDNRFIQNKGMAQNIADWVVKNWANGSEEATVDIFGNPLIELGDVVTINYPAKSLDPDTHKYFVVGVDHQWSEGLETRLILRRLKT